MSIALASSKEERARFKPHFGKFRFALCYEDDGQAGAVCTCVHLLEIVPQRTWGTVFVPELSIGAYNPLNLLTLLFRTRTCSPTTPPRKTQQNSQGVIKNVIMN